MAVNPHTDLLILRQSLGLEEKTIQGVLAEKHHMSLQECSLSPKPWVEVLASVYIVLIIHHSSCACTRMCVCVFVPDSYIRLKLVQFSVCRSKLTSFFCTGDLSSHNPRQCCDCCKSPNVQEWTCSLDRYEAKQRG